MRPFPICKIFHLLVYCADVDECSMGLARCDHGCVDVQNGTHDSYYCTCRLGFSLDRDGHGCTGGYVVICLI